MDQNESDKRWLAISLLIGGRKCVFCGYLWGSRADVLLREPIVAAKDPVEYACESCWKEGKRLAP